MSRPLSAWEQGCKAARAGLPMTACTYPRANYSWVVWMNGWCFTTYRMAIEDDDL